MSRFFSSRIGLDLKNFKSILLSAKSLLSWLATLAKLPLRSLAVLRQEHRSVPCLPSHRNAPLRHFSQHFQGPRAILVLQAAHQQRLKSLAICDTAIFQHGLVDFESHWEISTPYAGGHETGVNLCIQTKLEALGILLHHPEGGRQIAAAAVELDQNGQGEIGRCNAGIPGSGHFLL